MSHVAYCKQEASKITASYVILKKKINVDVLKFYPEVLAQSLWRALAVFKESALVYPQPAPQGC